MSRRRVVITGVGAVTPLGVGAESSFRRWVAGESGIEDGLGRCDEFSAADFLSRKEARRADRFTQLSIAAAQEALAQAGFQDGPAIDPGRVGCIEATGVGGISTIEEGQDALREKGGRSVSAQVVPMMMPNASAGTLALRYGLRGPSHCVASACAAGVRGSGRDLAVGHLSSLRRATRRFCHGRRGRRAGARGRGGRCTARPARAGRGARLRRQLRRTPHHGAPAGGNRCGRGDPEGAGERGHRAR